MVMLQIQTVLKVCALATPLLLLAQCTPEPSAPVAPAGSQVEARPCLDSPDPERSFDIVSPVAGTSLCGGACSQIRWQIQNACGEWVAKVEGWYDGTYHPLGELKMANFVHWDTPAAGCGCVRLRVTLTDDLGLIGVREVTVGPVVPPRRGRPPVERD